MELQRLEFYVSRMRNLVICYFVFKNQSHYSGVRGQRVKDAFGWDHVLTSDLRLLVHPEVTRAYCKSRDPISIYYIPLTIKGMPPG